MRTAPRISLGAQMTAVILLAITLSWVLSSGLTSYLAYTRIRALHQEMLARPDLYPYAIPEPRFGIREFLLGFDPRPRQAPPMPGRPEVGQPPPPWVLRPNAPPPNQGPPPRDDLAATSMLVFRAMLAILLALIAGAWMSSRFSRRLQELASGARAFDSGNFRHRVPETGDDEFTQLAVSMNEMAERVSNQISGLEEDASRRRQFLADMAHELRGPVTTMRTMAGALDEGLADDPERRARAVGSLVRASDRLLSLVNDLLQLAKLDLRELPIHPRNIELRELASSAVEAHQAAASQAGIVLHPVEGDAKVHAFADPDRLTQVLDNLLINALSHAGEGSQVRVRVEGGDAAKIVIADNGRGIPASDLPYVFEPFYRVDSVRSPSEGHSGLGLRICKGLVEAQGGTLTLTSREGAGTTVTITLPGTAL